MSSHLYQFTVVAQGFAPTELSFRGKASHALKEAQQLANDFSAAVTITRVTAGKQLVSGTITPKETA